MDLKITDGSNLLASNASRISERYETKMPEKAAQENRSFVDALRKAHKNVAVSFSKHAEERLSEWGETTKEEYMGDLSEAMDIAQAKGARSTLVITKGAAFLVAPQTRTVITVVPEDRMKENLFTSIDSAVLMGK